MNKIKLLILLFVGRMVIDIVKFFFIYSLVLFAFACGKSMHCRRLYFSYLRIKMHDSCNRGGFMKMNHSF